MKIHTVAIVLAVAASACSLGTAPSGRDLQRSTTQEDAAVEDTLSIPIGGSRFADGGKLQIHFVARLSDSRCPADVVCVWEGDAHVRISTRFLGGEIRSAELHSRLEPREVVADGYAITMVGMTPYPGTGNAGAPPVLIVRVVRGKG